MCCVSVFFQNYQCNFFECTHQKESFWSVILVIFLKHSKIGILWETNKQILFDGFKPFHFIPVPSAWTKTHLTQNCHLVWISLKDFASCIVFLSICPTQPQWLQWHQVQAHLLDGKLVRKPIWKLLLKFHLVHKWHTWG